MSHHLATCESFIVLRSFSFELHAGKLHGEEDGTNMENEINGVI